MAYERMGCATEILQTHPLKPYIMTDSKPYLSNVPPTYMGNLLKMVP